MWNYFPIDAMLCACTEEAEDHKLLKGATLNDEFKKPSSEGGSGGSGGATVAQLDAQIDALEEGEEKDALESERAQLDKMKADVEADLQDALHGGSPSQNSSSWGTALSAGAPPLHLEAP